jgi:signal transduction histidine kinase
VRLPLRSRVFLSLLGCLLIGTFFLPWALQLARNIRRAAFYDSVFLRCSDDWRDLGTRACSPQDFSVPWAVALLVTCSVLVLAAMAGLTVWSGRPLRRLSDTVRRFGPQNLAERSGRRSRRGQFGRLTGEIDAMLDRVAEGYDAQRRFAANASHELRTPLALQRTLIEVGMAGDPTPEQLGLLTRQLLDTNERNEALIEGLLVLAETDQGLAARAPQRLDAIASDVAATYQHLAAAAGVRLRADVEPVTVAGEASLLERLVANLVHNGIKYNVPGGEVCLQVGPDEPVLRVTNTGPVVAAESVPRLFEPFRRARGDRLDHSGGAGLGLTIARSIAQAHRGSIAAAAQPAGGLRVTVELPGTA